MYYVGNIIIVAVALLIAYWWANQGLLSSLLHMLCVMVAGAIAFAFWEPVTMFLMSGSGFDDYAWGISLILLFAISLVVLRVGMDKLAPANARLPHWANLTFGGLAGAWSAVLTVGILLIGVGHVQSDKVLLGLRGYARSAQTGAVREQNRLWLPAHKITSEFYGFLSVNALASTTPMRHYTPNVYQQATLLRDSVAKGKGKFSLLPEAASVRGVTHYNGPDGERFIVKVRFENEARDFGDQLTLSAAQIRLIGEPASRTAKAETVHPCAWRIDGKVYLFDSATNYLTGKPGREQATPEIEFKVPRGFVPRFLQVRGTRLELPNTPITSVASPLFSGDGAVEIVSGGEIDDLVHVSNDIRPISVSTNVMPGGIKEVDRWLTQGEAVFQVKGRASRDLAILGIYEPGGTRVVKVDVSRGTAADIFQFRLPNEAEVKLVDAAGNTYSPIGYMHKHANGTTIKLEPVRFLRTIGDLPVLPTSGSENLRLLFYVTLDSTVVGLQAGEYAVGRCGVPVTEKKTPGRRGGGDE